MMIDAEYKQVKLIVNAGSYILTATERNLDFDGFLKLSGRQKENGENNDVEKLVKLPDLKRNQTLSLAGQEAEQKFTKPPGRFTEGTLIRDMEQSGVGRPSTYAQIITTITKRKYVAKIKKNLKPTPLGMEVLELLVKLFPGLFDVDFTAKMEEDLDKVEEGKLDWVELLRGFYTDFEPILVEANKKRSHIKKELEQKTEHKCEKCGSPMIIKWGRYGKFLACSNFPECKNTKPIDDNGEVLPEIEVDRVCPKCGKPLVVKHDRRERRFLACSGYPDCKYTEPFDTGFECPNENCDGRLVEKYTRKNKVFFGCSKYPDCDFASWDPPTKGKCPSCGHETMFLIVRKSGVTRKCKRCGYSETVEETSHEKE
jgi:DNA topoisomerase-1